MYFTTMTHRDELFDLTLRWLNDDFHAEDGLTLTRIFLYESAVSVALVDRVVAFLTDFCQAPLQLERIRQKQVLRRRLIEYLPHSTERSRQIIARFNADPEYFFPRLPINGLLAITPDDRLAAIGRIKRLTRVAEKVSYRLVNALFREIKAEARQIAARRAVVAGISIADLVSTEQEMHDDFTAAETVVAGRFRDHDVRIDKASVTVNDLLGFKIIGEPDQLRRVPEVLARFPGFTVAETEVHSGNYNAVNLLVHVALPSPDRLVEELWDYDWSIAARRGLDPADVAAGFRDYLSRGANNVCFEIILTTYDELMESEFGRSMHELRILRFRQREAFCGPIAQNAASLVEYLLALALSPTVIISELPIKMYGRYLPETIAIAKCALCGKKHDDGLLQAFSPRAD